jgi:hypothetical protein
MGRSTSSAAAAAAAAAAANLQAQLCYRCYRPVYLQVLLKHSAAPVVVVAAAAAAAAATAYVDVDATSLLIHSNIQH